MSKKVRKVANKKMKNEPCLVGVGAIILRTNVRVYITNSDVLQLKMMMFKKMEMMMGIINALQFDPFIP